MEKIIIDGVDVSECPHINAYFPDSPKCQQGMGVGGCGSECRGKCSYVDKLKIHNEIQQLKQENEDLIERANAYNGMKILANCRLEKLEKIEEIVKATQKDLCNNCGWHNTDGCDTEDNICGEFKRILQIIRGEE